jgi:Tfp pilus assembly protein PilF
LKKIGSLDIVDTVYQNKMEQLITRAERDYRKVIALDSSMSFAHFNLGHLLATAERYEEAEVQFGKAASVRGNFIKANYNRGLIRLLLGKPTKACEDLSLAGELGFTDAYSVINQYCD